MGSTTTSTETVLATGMAPAVSAVFGTYELLECIILALPAKYIAAAFKVNRTWNNVVTTSLSINKQLVSSRFFFRTVISKHVKDPGIKHFEFFWADMIIKQHNGRELIYIRDKSTLHPIRPQFVDSVVINNLPFLTDNDRIELSRGWAHAFRGRRGKSSLKALRIRVAVGLYAYLDPARTQLAQDVCDVLSDWRRGRKYGSPRSTPWWIIYRLQKPRETSYEGE